MVGRVACPRRYLVMTKFFGRALAPYLIYYGFMQISRDGVGTVPYGLHIILNFQFSIIYHSFFHFIPVRRVVAPYETAIGMM